MARKEAHISENRKQNIFAARRDGRNSLASHCERSIFRARDFSGQSRSRLRRACKKLPDGRITRSQIVRLGNAHARP
jgi:hypothetical protein